MSNVRISRLTARRRHYMAAAILTAWYGTAGFATGPAGPAAAEAVAGQKVIYFDEKDRFGIKLPEGYLCTHDPEKMMELCEEQRLVPWRTTVAVIQPAHRFWAMFVRRADTAANPAVHPSSGGSSNRSFDEQRPVSAAEREAFQRKIDSTLLPTFQESIETENGLRRKLGWSTLAVIGFERPVVLGNDLETTTCVIRLRDSGGQNHTMFYDTWRADYDKPLITTVAIVPASRATEIEPEYRKLASAVGYHVDPKWLATLKTEVGAEKARNLGEFLVWPYILLLVLSGVGVVVYSLINERQKKNSGRS